MIHIYAYNGEFRPAPDDGGDFFFSYGEKSIFRTFLMETKKQTKKQTRFFCAEKTQRGFRVAEKTELGFSFCVDEDRFYFRTLSPFKRSGVTVRIVNNLFLYAQAFS